MIRQQDFRDMSIADVYKEQKKTCKDCIHCDVCYMRETCSDIDSQLREFGCEDFKDISKYKEIVYGEWMVGDNYTCSNCDCDAEYKFATCPYCGADMRGDK